MANESLYTKQNKKSKELVALAREVFGKQYPDHKKWDYVYFIKCNEYYKIGTTFNLINRVNSLQCGCPYELELVFAMQLPNAKEMEFILQEKYKDKHHMREWYKLDQSDINFQIECYMNLVE